jgi:hypothetical protein
MKAYNNKVTAEMIIHFQKNPKIQMQWTSRKIKIKKYGAHQ